MLGRSWVIISLRSKSTHIRAPTHSSLQTTRDAQEVPDTNADSEDPRSLSYPTKLRATPVLKALADTPLLGGCLSPKPARSLPIVYCYAPHSCHPQPCCPPSLRLACALAQPPALEQLRHPALPSQDTSSAPGSSRAHGYAGKMK